MRFKINIVLVSLFNLILCDNKIENVLLLVADDASFEMGAYLNHYCQTPNLDKFAKKSLLFNNAFTSVSSCSPSRAQILTGLTSHQNGMYGLHHSVHHFNVFDNIQTISNVLTENNIYNGLIGKKHVGPNANFKFMYEETEEQHSINQIGRNITKIKSYVEDFFNNYNNLKSQNHTNGFFLMIGFHDPHRCGHITPEYGEFCERWGSGELNMGQIPDWKPIYYDWENLPDNLNSYLPNTDNARKELAAQYQTISRLDQGVGLIINELIKNNFLNNTLIIYTSDNGPPFPGGRTNFYDPGIREPMLIYSPEENVRRNSVTYSMTSLLDIFPTILDAFKIDNSTLLRNLTEYTGKSLLPLLEEEPPNQKDDAIFGSQNFHEITMDYPMRMIRTKRYKLIHNLNYQSYFPIDQDSYTSLTFQEILNLTITKQPLPWFKTLKKYYERDEWELYDLKLDSLEQFNVINKNTMKTIVKDLKERLKQWQIKTNDPWLCSPHGVLQNQGIYKMNPVCMTLGHESIKQFLN